MRLKGRINVTRVRVEYRSNDQGRRKTTPLSCQSRSIHYCLLVEGVCSAEKRNHIVSLL